MAPVSRVRRVARRVREKGPARLARRFVGMVALYGWRDAFARIRYFAEDDRAPLTVTAPLSSYSKARQAQYDFCVAYARTAPAWRRRILESLLLGEAGAKGVVLCPVVEPQADSRTLRLMQSFGQAGYVVLVLPIDSAIPSVDKLSERVYVARLFPDAFACFASEPVVLFVAGPRFAYVTRLFDRATVIYDIAGPLQATGSDADAERHDHRDLLRRATCVVLAHPRLASLALRTDPFRIVEVPEDPGGGPLPDVSPIVEHCGQATFVRPSISLPPGRRVDIINCNFFDWHGDRIYNGGAERYVLDLALLCRRMGLEPRLMQNAHRPFEREYQGVPVVGLQLSGDFDLLRMSTAYARHVADASLVIASPLELAARLDRRAGLIGINHGVHWDSSYNTIGAHTLDRDRLLFLALQQVDACVCVDTNFINWVRCHDWQLAQVLDYVPNYVDTAAFRPAEKHFDAERLVVLYPRRLYKARGFQDAMQACDGLLARGVPIDVHFCGGADEPEAALARAFVARHPLHSRWFELPMREMHRAYAESHIVLIPTNWAEGTSLSCIEAMATRNGVIATTVGGLPNLILDGFNGLLVKPGAGGLARAIERLVADRALLALLAENALRVVPSLTHLRWDRQWTEVLARLLPPGMLAKQEA